MTTAHSDPNRPAHSEQPEHDPQVTSTATSVLTTMDWYLVRVGLMGNVGRFRPAESTTFRRGARVVCRTPRGIETGVILAAASPVSEADLADGRILRRMTPEDELLWGHLRELSNQAHQACEVWLRENGIQATLYEVEPLMDGKTLYFHFLSEVDQSVQQRLDELVAVYEAEVRNSKFARLLEHGCGPGCGTDKAVNGCGSSKGCAVCKIASACSTRRG